MSFVNLRQLFSGKKRIIIIRAYYDYIVWLIHSIIIVLDI